uniref:Uncharacterized protein n=1 Tax=Salvator merianae TaxID=96440 RepID=A0A8D0C151_SALMN
MAANKSCNKTNTWTGLILDWFFALDQWSPTFFAPGTGFKQDHFFMARQGGMRVGQGWGFGRVYCWSAAAARTGKNTPTAQSWSTDRWLGTPALACQRLTWLLRG